MIIEFTWGTDMDFAGIEVRERLDLLWLPIDATRPLLLRFDPSSEPVMRVAFVDEFPMTSTGKIKKVKLRERARTEWPDAAR